jgi:hypothetical protein
MNKLLTNLTPFRQHVLLLYKSYRQVLTLIDNLQHLLRLPIFEKTGLVTFHLKCNKENYFFLLEREK